MTENSRDNPVPQRTVSPQKRTVSPQLGLAIAITLVVTVVFRHSVIEALAAVVWLGVGIRWLIRRYGRRAVASLSILAFCLLIWGSIAWYQDRPNARLAQQIQKLGRVDVFSSGRFLTGTIQRVYFHEDATDATVHALTQLPGADGLEWVSFRGSRITDAALLELTQLPRLRVVDLNEVDVTEAGIVSLLENPSGCEVWEDGEEWRLVDDDVSP
jgi:hypothetical protein